MFDPEERRVYVSRDVIFEETCGWDWDSQSDGTQEENQFILVNENEEKQNDTSNASDSNNFQTNDRENSREATPEPVSAQRAYSKNYDDSSTPKKFRSIASIYNETEEVELNDELLFVGMEEPVFYKDASKDREWRIAMDKEMESIEKNGMWKLTSLPPGHKVIGLKWVFKLKKDANGNVVKYKARVVAKGYVQEHGIDFEEVFAPVTRLETVRMLLALATKNKWEVHHLDVNTAFLNGEINEEVYVSQPEGYVKEGQEYMV